MSVLLAVLLLAILLGGFGFAYNVLWYLAAVVLVVWLVGFVARSGQGQWYRW